jgi:thiol-disulfide isomerase/thioredoxin|tara:strand:+ start:279 stop:752 length:474 start_codon:yes stop_codon:yes gene_type:complete
MKLISSFLLLLLFLIPVDSIYAEQSPEFWLKSMEGKRFRSSKQNSPYVISFFFVNCLPCIKEIPMLHQFMSTNYPSIPLLFIDPIKSDSKKDIKKFSKTLKVPLSNFYKDSFGSISKKFFKKGKMYFPTIVGIKGKKYLFRYSKIDNKILNEMESLL